MTIKTLIFRRTNQISMLTAQMEVLQVLLKDGDYSCFDPEREILKEVITLFKLIVINPAISAAG